MLPFFNSFYALEDNKKKVVKYYEKVEEFNHLGSLNNMQATDQTLMAKSMGSLPNLLG
jgi:tryptophan synthase beta subunit